MKGDKVLKVYGTNSVVYEIDEGWVVPEIAPDPEYFPPYVPPTTDPADLELITDIQWVTGKLDSSMPPTEDVIVETARYTTRWIKVKPEARYIITCKFSNTFVLQFKSNDGEITFMNIPPSVTNANIAIQTGRTTEWVRFYFYSGYEVLHEISMQQVVFAEPNQPTPIAVGTQLGYLDGNREPLQKDPLVFNRTTDWFDVKKNTTYLTYFETSNRFFMQYKSVVVDDFSGFITTTITMPVASRTSAHARYFTTGSNTTQVRIWYSEDLYGGQEVRILEQLPI